MLFFSKRNKCQFLPQSLCKYENLETLESDRECNLNVDEFLMYAIPMVAEEL